MSDEAVGNLCGRFRAAWKIGAAPAIEEFVARSGFQDNQATLYYFLSGGYPYEFPDSPGSLKAVYAGEIVPLETRLPDLPPELIDIVHKAMAEEPSERFSSALDMYQTLYPLARGS